MAYTMDIMKNILSRLLIVFHLIIVHTMAYPLQNEHQKLHIVMVILESTPQDAPALQTLLLQAAQLGRQEEDCLLYTVHRDTKNQSQFILYEQWKSQEAHRNHHQVLAALGLVKRLEELLAKPKQAFFVESIN
jgi:quinol monooxygenase YgiN